MPNITKVYPDLVKFAQSTDALFFMDTVQAYNAVHVRRKFICKPTRVSAYYMYIWHYCVKVLVFWHVQLLKFQIDNDVLLHWPQLVRLQFRREVATRTWRNICNGNGTLGLFLISASQLSQTAWHNFFRVFQNSKRRCRSWYHRLDRRGRRWWHAVPAAQRTLTRVHRAPVTRRPALPRRRRRVKWWNSRRRPWNLRLRPRHPRQRPAVGMSTSGQLK